MSASNFTFIVDRRAARGRARAQCANKRRARARRDRRAIASPPPRCTATNPIYLLYSAVFGDRAPVSEIGGKRQNDLRCGGMWKGHLCETTCSDTRCDQLWILRLLVMLKLILLL